MRNQTREVIGIRAIVSIVFGILSGICAIPFFGYLVILFGLRGLGLQFSFVEKLNIPVTQESFFIENAILLGLGIPAFVSGLSLMLKTKITQQVKNNKLYALTGLIGGTLSLTTVAGNLLLWFILTSVLNIGG